jgi:hypothetical protein
MGKAMLLRQDTVRETNAAAATERYDEALRFWSREEFSEEWATVHKDMGDAFRPSDPSGSREDIELAISHYEEALSVRSRADFPVEHAELCLLLTGPLIFLAMQLVETPEKERAAMSRALHYYKTTTDARISPRWAKSRDASRSSDVLSR